MIQSDAEGFNSYLASLELILQLKTSSIAPPLVCKRQPGIPKAVSAGREEMLGMTEKHSHVKCNSHCMLQRALKTTNLEMDVYSKEPELYLVLSAFHREVLLK